MIGKMNKCKVTKIVEAGMYVDCGQFGELMIPGWDVTSKAEVGDEIEVFLLLNERGKPVATMRRPPAMPGEVALLKVAVIEDDCALLDWGMPVRLKVPLKEQQQKMIKGFSYVVYILQDKKTGRISGSTRLDKFLTTTPERLQLNDEVSLIICDLSELGYRAVINNYALGFLYNNDIFQTLKVGDKITGYIKNIREDGRVDLYLQKPGFAKVADISEQILDKIRSCGGFIGVTDKSPAEEIYELFGTSKKTYKKAIGGLYKNGLVILEENGVRLASKKTSS